MKKLITKFFCLALLVFSVAVVASCKTTKYTVTYFNVTDEGAQNIGTESVAEGSAPKGKVSGYVLAGDLYKDAELKEVFSGTISADISLYGKFLNASEKSYTYDASFSLSPSTFNPLQYKSTTDSVPLDYTTNSFYEFSYNATETGFELVPVMAAADPVDVTSQYSADNKWGIEGKESGYAFRVALNPDAKWENGEAITADDYIYTMKELLNPEMNNYRASNYYEGSTVIFGAKDYYYSGQSGIDSADLTYSVFEEGIYDKLIFRWNENSKTKFFSWLTGYSSYLSAFGPTWVDLLNNGFGAGFTFTNDQVAALDGKKYSEIVANPEWDAIVDALIAFYCTDPNEELVFFEAEYSMPEYSFDNVGLIKIDDYTVDIIYTGELAGFYIKYSIGLPLVNETLWEQCKKVDSATGALSSSYGTSRDTYIGYGPYKMTEYIVDQIMVFEKNENWFGYSPKYADTYGSFVAEFDGQEHQQFQTTKIVLRYVPEISTREQMFLSGQLAAFGMNKEYFDRYKSSIRLYNATGASTYYGIILSDYESLVEREAVLNGKTYDENYKGSEQQYNKTILTIKKFRQALCYALDRKTVCANLYPGGSPATSLFSNLITADPDNGIAFNDFDETKAAICEFWGVKYGEGEDFATLEEAYAAITGFDLTSAKVLVEEAYQEALQAGLIGENSIVKIDYCGSTDSETEQLWYQTFNNCFVELFKGTSLEGRFEYVYNTNLGSDFGAAIQNGQADTAWGFGWSGGELDPYSLFEVFVDSASGKEEPYQYDKWINRNNKEYSVKLSLDIDGKGAKDYEYTVYEWFLILNGDKNAPDGLNWKYLQVPNEVRAAVLAACEKAVLQDYTNIPLFNQGSVQLLSYKLNYGKETYMFGMGFGGIRYTTYNFTDAEWQQYLNDNNGVLKY